MDPDEIRSNWLTHQGCESRSNSSDCGVHFLKLRCKTTVGKHFHDGHIKEFLGVAKDVKVFIDEENKDAMLWSGCANVSKLVSGPNVVDTRGFGVDLLEQKNPKSLYVAHDMFDDEYSSWILVNGAKRRDAPWWITQAQNILKTMKIMKDEQVYHGSLHKKESYVTRAKAIQILNFGNYFRGKGWAEMVIASKNADDAVKADKKALKDFFKSEVLIDNWELWEHFLECFDDLTYNQLRKHLVLLGELEIYNYMRKITYKVRNMSAGDQVTFRNKLRDTDRGRSVGWVRKFSPGDVFYRTLTYGGAKVPEVQDAATLFEFMGKLLDHFDENARALKITVTGQEMLVSLFSTKYHLLFATLHRVAVAVDISFLSEVAGYFS